MSYFTFTKFKRSLAVGLCLLAGLGGALAAQAKITPAEAKERLDKDKATVLIDVRADYEFAEGHIKGAKLLPYDQINADRAARLIPGKDSPVILYCRSGRRSAIAAESLAKLGYTKVWDLGGIGSWPYGTVKGKD